MVTQAGLCTVTAVGERRLMLFAPQGTLGTIRSGVTRWRRSSRPAWLVAAIFWLAYLIVAAFLDSWPMIFVGCFQLAITTAMAWDAR